MLLLQNRKTKYLAAAIESSRAYLVDYADVFSAYEVGHEGDVSISLYRKCKIGEELWIGITILWKGYNWNRFFCDWGWKGATQTSNPAPYSLYENIWVGPIDQNY